MSPAAAFKPIDLPVIRDFMVDKFRDSLREVNLRAINLADRSAGRASATSAMDTAARLADDEINRLRLAELFYVSEAMTDLATQAGSVMPGFSLAREDLPSEYGLIIFGSPLASNDSGAHELIIGKRAPVYICAASWGLAHSDKDHYTPNGAVWVTFWTDTLRIVQDSLAAGEYSSEQAATALQRGNRLSLENEILWPFGDDVAVDDKQSPYNVAAATLKAAWVLMQQEGLADEHTEVLPRASQRRMAGRSPDLMRTRVITLRRPASGDGSQMSEREYKNRWVVRGHWRQQWYAHRGVHRPIWIAPHIKGPDGAPILGGEKVYSWSK